MQTGRARLALLLIATAAAARVVLFGILDRRPLYGGWEGSDLQRSMFYHYGLRGHLDWTFAEQVTRDGFKPPLWFGGVPALFGWKPSLSALDYLLVNAAAMGGAVVIAFALGKRLGGARGGLCAAALTAFLPGVAWRIGMVGVEPTHMVLLPAAVLALLALLHEAEHRSLKTAAPVGVVLGVLAGAGLDAEALLRKATTPDIKGRLRANTEAAQAAGACGVPTFELDDNLIWGQDRLDDLDAYLGSLEE